jgi:hypothetical protein
MIRNDNFPTTPLGPSSHRSKRVSALAGAAIAALLAGGTLAQQGWSAGLSSTVQAAEAIQQVPGFADLVAKLKWSAPQK